MCRENISRSEWSQAPLAAGLHLRTDLRLRVQDPVWTCAEHWPLANEISLSLSLSFTITAVWVTSGQITMTPLWFIVKELLKTCATTCSSVVVVHSPIIVQTIFQMICKTIFANCPPNVLVMISIQLSKAMRHAYKQSWVIRSFENGLLLPTLFTFHSGQNNKNIAFLMSVLN